MIIFFLKKQQFKPEEKLKTEENNKGKGRNY